MRQAEAIIDFGSSKVVCMVGRCNSDGRFEIYGIGSSEYKGIKNKRVLDEPGLRLAVQKAIESAQTEARRTIRSVHVGVPGPYVRVECGVCEIKISDTPVEITRKDVDVLMEHAVKESETPEGYTRAFSVPYHYRVDGSPRNTIPTGVQGTTIWSVVSHIYIEKEFEDFIANILEETGVEVDSFVDAAFAEAIMLIPQNRQHDEAIVADVGYYHTDVLIMRDSACVFRTTIPVGGWHVANDLSVVLSIAPSEAERIKKQYAFGLAYNDRTDTFRMKNGATESVVYEDIQDIIEARAFEIAMLVKEAVMRSAVQIPPETPLYLVGGGVSMMRGSRELFQEGSSFMTITDLPWMPRKNTANFASAYGMLNYVCKSELGSDLRPRLKERKFMQSLINFFTK